eukprot:TRINITY_DN8554_c0_g1_i1.p1 TRINITY_DN8554_c0_g1~~TRINITY_DN8554_c0_g1_i1.p1  ORF type:complete len:463 (+),score=246.60 TRINITY_DN8554_c0_g1_i1:247-1635(+)
MVVRKAGVTDYSKWDNIELSDDESDCHPNIEKGTWFRLKHQQRVDREKEEAKEREGLDKTISEGTAKLESGEVTDEAQRKSIQEEVEKAQARIEKMEKNKKWNVDNMCKTVEDRTIVNHETAPHADGYAIPEVTDKDKSFLKSGKLTEEAKVQTYQDYCDNNKELLETFMSLKTMEETHNLMKDNVTTLLQEHASWYLLLACLEAEMAGDRKKMKLCARQSQVISSITELAKTERRHPGNIIEPFFERLKDPKRFSMFVEGVDGFAQRIIERAVAKREEQKLGLAPGGDMFSEGLVVEAHGLKGAQELNGMRGEVKGRLKSGRIGIIFPEPHGEKALKEENLKVIPIDQLKEEQKAAEEEDKDPNKCWWLPNHLPREERLGPGGTDPVELFAELPTCLQEAFRSREMEPLHQAIEQLGPDEAEIWLKKCSKAGLWNPEGAGDDEEDEPEPEEAKPKRPAAAL